MIKEKVFDELEILLKAAFSDNKRLNGFLIEKSIV